MAYNDNDDMLLDSHDSDGVNRGDSYLTESTSGPVVSDKELVDELNEFLMSPRFDNDMCITLTMPTQMLKKAREKLNAAIIKVYERHKSPVFKIFDVLVALESMADASVISSLLDLDIKHMIAADRGIVISDQQLDDIASGKAAKSSTGESSIVECPKCHGYGEIDGDECPLCLGLGKVKRIVGQAQPQAQEDDDDDDNLDIDMDDMSELDGLDDVVLEEL